MTTKAHQPGGIVVASLELHEEVQRSRRIEHSDGYLALGIARDSLFLEKLMRELGLVLLAILVLPSARAHCLPSPGVARYGMVGQF